MPTQRAPAMPKAHRRPQGHRPKPQEGLVLVIALILMAVIGISSSAAIRLALATNAISMGLRANNEAFQRADTALRWCELQTRRRFKYKGASPDTDNFYLVPKDVNSRAMSSNFDLVMQNSRPVPAVILNNAGFTGNQAPRCLSQEEEPSLGKASADDNDKTAAPANGVFSNYTVTVRATSTDFRETTRGSDAGSEVWLKVTLIPVARD